MPRNGAASGVRLKASRTPSTRIHAAGFSATRATGGFARNRPKTVPRLLFLSGFRFLTIPTIHTISFRNRHATYPPLRNLGRVYPIDQATVGAKRKKALDAAKLREFRSDREKKP
jgi:hypothetical protein